MKRALPFAALAFACATHAETALYETGPGQDAAFVRFLNATGREATVVSASGSARVVLGTKDGARVTKFYPVAAGTRLSATLGVEGTSLPAVVVAKPGEYVTVAAIEAPSGAVETRLLRETPSDYNAARASVALANADAACPKATMTGGAKAVQVVGAVVPFAIGRRLVNPVKLPARVACGGGGKSVAVDLGQLEAGERYTAFLIGPRAGRSAFFARDDVFAGDGKP